MVYRALFGNGTVESGAILWYPLPRSYTHRTDGMSNQEKLVERLEALKAEHRDIDDAIQALSQRGMPDMIQLQRLKKKKLQLRDEIILLESQILPDIIA